MNYMTTAFGMKICQILITTGCQLLYSMLLSERVKVQMLIL